MSRSTFTCRSCELGPCYVASNTNPVRGGIYALDQIELPDCPYRVEDTSNVTPRFTPLVEESLVAAAALIDWGWEQEGLPTWIEESLIGNGLISTVASRSYRRVWDALINYFTQQENAEQLKQVLDKSTKSEIALTVFHYGFLAGLLHGHRMDQDEQYRNENTTGAEECF